MDMGLLRRDVRLLGNVLGQVIREQEGREVFDLEERIRLLAKQWRSQGDEATFRELAEICESLSPDMAWPILKAFTTYFHLVNLAEEHHRVRVLRQREAQSRGEPLPDSVAEAIQVLHQHGLSADQVQDVLNRVLVEFVFTAHPTEPKRRSILYKLRRISDILYQLETQRLLPREREARLTELHAWVTLLWQTHEVRLRRPTVLDEVRHGLWFFTASLFGVVPEVHRALGRALRRFYPQHEFHLPLLVQFGSWIGGDRDGNPYVTAEVTVETLNLHRRLAQERHAQNLRHLVSHLSLSSRRSSLTPETQRWLMELRQQHPMLARRLHERFPQEPLRHLVALLLHRLGEALPETQEGAWEDVFFRPRTFYASGDDLARDLHRLKRELRAQGSEDVVEALLEPVHRQAEAFGLHTARLDIRQHSGVHEAMVEELLRQAGLAASYRDLPEEAKMRLLTRLLREGRFPAYDPLTLSDTTRDMLLLLSLVRDARATDPNALGVYLISMTESASDVLEVLWLMGVTGVYRPQTGEGMDIAPLFETIADLEGAHLIMQALYRHPVYRQHLAQRGYRQVIQLGYSDSTKDGGYLRANWALYQAQQRLVEEAKQHGIKVVIFHGRGGAVGRGGGPTHRAILGLPPGTLQGLVRLTEQGEVISDRFAHPVIAQRYIEQVLGAVIQVTAGLPEQRIDPHWEAAMQDLAEVGYRAYRSLVYETPEFLTFFYEATPIDVIGELTIGSRPARRKPGRNIEDLRAIPWVFSWMQSRFTLPGWYGLGTALQTFLQRPQGLALLQDMYRHWRFFQAVVDNAQMVMAKADMHIARRYASLVQDATLRDTIFQRIRKEFETARTGVLRITGQKELLDNEPWLQQAIRLRNPYVDPLSLVQVGLLRRYRSLPPEAPEREHLLDALRLSIVGIAAGLKNTG